MLRRKFPWIAVIMFLVLLVVGLLWRVTRPGLLMLQGAEVERLFPQEDGGAQVLLHSTEARAVGKNGQVQESYELIAIGPKGRMRWRVPLPGFPSYAASTQITWSGSEFWYLQQEGEKRRVLRIGPDGRVEPLQLPSLLDGPGMHTEGFVPSADGKRLILFTHVRGKERWLKVLASAPISSEGRARYRNNARPVSDEYPLIWWLDRRSGSAELLDLAWPDVKVAEFGYLDKRLEWSPDGKYLVVDQGSSAGTELIALLDGGGRNYRVLQRDPSYGLMPPVWSKDSRYLFLADWERTRCWKYDPGSQRKTPISSFQYRLAAEMEVTPGLYLELRSDTPDAGGPKQAFLFQPPAGLVEQLQGERDWKAGIDVGRISSSLLFQGEDLREVRFSPSGQWVFAVIATASPQRQEVCRVRVTDPSRQKCLLVIHPPQEKKDWNDRPAAWVDPGPYRNHLLFPWLHLQALAEGIRYRVGAIGAYDLTLVTLDPRRTSLQPAFIDGRQWIHTTDLQDRPEFLLAVSGPPGGSKTAGRVAGDLYDGRHLYRASTFPSLRRMMAKRYHLRLLADGTVVFGRGIFAGTWSDRSFIGGLGILFNGDPRGDRAAANNDPSLWRAVRGNHPAARVAAGLLADGRLALVMARDRYNPSLGPTLPQLSRWLVHLGLQEAYFLDGGSAACLTGPGIPADCTARSFVAVYQTASFP